MQFEIEVSESVFVFAYVPYTWMWNNYLDTYKYILN